MLARGSGGERKPNCIPVAHTGISQCGRTMCRSQFMHDLPAQAQVEQAQQCNRLTQARGEADRAASSFKHAGEGSCRPCPTHCRSIERKGCHAAQQGHCFLLHVCAIAHAATCQSAGVCMPFQCACSLLSRWQQEMKFGVLAVLMRLTMANNPAQSDCCSGSVSPYCVYLADNVTVLLLIGKVLLRSTATS